MKRNQKSPEQRKLASLKAIERRKKMNPLPEQLRAWARIIAQNRQR